MISYLKWSADESNSVIVVVNLNPWQVREATLEIADALMGRLPRAPFIVDDLISGERYAWGSRNYVRLDPIGGAPVHILRVAST